MGVAAACGVGPCMMRTGVAGAYLKTTDELPGFYAGGDAQWAAAAGVLGHGRFALTSGKLHD